MARRPAFYIDQGKVVSKMYSFEWFSGFAVSQKQKSIESLHNAILREEPGAKEHHQRIDQKLVSKSHCIRRVSKI